MNFFDNSSISQSSCKEEFADRVHDSDSELYPLLIDYAAFIVGRTLRPEPGMFKFRSKLLKTTFDKDDIWAFVVRNEDLLLICRVACGPYKEFEIIDEIHFPNLDDYAHTQSKVLRLPPHSEVSGPLQAMELIASCMKRRTAVADSGPVSPALATILRSVRDAYKAASRCSISEDKILSSLENLFGDILQSPLPDGSPSLLCRFNIERMSMDPDEVMASLRRQLLGNGDTPQKSTTAPSLKMPDLLKAIIHDNYGPAK